MQWVKPVQLITIVLALAAATGAAPPQAVPAPAADAAECGPTDTHAADHVLGRGQQREPDLDRTAEDLPAAAKNRAAKNFAATVPVWIHVVTDGSTGNLTAEHIAAQLAVLDNTFGGGEGGTRTGFRFELAGVTRTDNADWFYANPGGVHENTMKRTLHRGGPETLNFYSTTAGGYLGWAYLPDIVTKPGQTHLDGVVVDWESIPGTSTTYEGRYDQGETGTHEVGHWLNLLHTFDGGCSAKGDHVADTPPQKTPSSGCPEGKDTCRQPGLDPIHNYMDYSYDTCYTEFTPDQSQRMADSWLLYRAGA